MAAETIARALGGRMVGGGWMSRCPAHDDGDRAFLSATATTARLRSAAMPAATRSLPACAGTLLGKWRPSLHWLRWRSREG
jgi:hypothetical protein